MSGDKQAAADVLMFAFVWQSFAATAKCLEVE
jgi:hypothetical protein